MSEVTIEALIDRAHAHGLKMNNLFEYDDTSWQANFRDGAGGKPYGQGRTPVEAIEAALKASGVKIAQVDTGVGSLVETPSQIPRKRGVVIIKKSKEG